MTDDYYVEIFHRGANAYRVTLFDFGDGSKMEHIASIEYLGAEVLSCVYTNDNVAANHRNAVLTLTNGFDPLARHMLRILRDEYRRDHGPSENAIIFSASYNDDDLQYSLFDADTVNARITA